MICAGLESGAADSCQVLILGFCFCFLLSHYGLVERKLHAVCVCFRVTAGARCSATARIRIGFIRLAWRASETSVDFLSSLGCTHESAFFQSGWLRVRQRWQHLSTERARESSQLCSLLLWRCSETSRLAAINIQTKANSSERHTLIFSYTVHNNNPVRAVRAFLKAQESHISYSAAYFGVMV